MIGEERHGTEHFAGADEAQDGLPAVAACLHDASAARADRPGARGRATLREDDIALRDTLDPHPAAHLFQRMGR
jgi:hypothetical protein